MTSTADKVASAVPDNARMLYDSLDWHPEYLGRIRYSVMGLGGSTQLDWLTPALTSATTTE